MLQIQHKGRGQCIRLTSSLKATGNKCHSICEELASIFETDIVSMHGKLMLTSDFDIHMGLMTDPDTITLMDFLDCFNLQNHVNFLTHIQHHHLDLVISDMLDSIVSSLNPGHLLSDHEFIHVKLHINKPVPLQKY